MKITARADYAVRAVAELAATKDQHLTADKISAAQAIPQPFLAAILQDLNRAGIVQSRRGTDGGHRLVRPPAEVSLADVIRAIDGPLAGVGGQAPEEISTTGPAAILPQVWVATRSALREVLENVTFADLVAERLPPAVRRRIDAPGAWHRR